MILVDDLVDPSWVVTSNTRADKIREIGNRKTEGKQRKSREAREIRRADLLCTYFVSCVLCPVCVYLRACASLDFQHWG
jgi:hypothetical protein